MEPGFLVDDIAIDPADGALFAIATKPDDRARLLQIDKITGRSTLVTVIESADIEGLTFDDDSSLLGTIGDDGREVVEIDRSTGRWHTRYHLGADGNRDYEAISCRSGDRERPPFIPSDSRTPGDLLSIGSFPNPISSVATLWIKTNKVLDVRLAVYDLLGRRRELIFSGLVAAGEERWTYDASALEPGIYVLRARTRLQSMTHSVVVAR
jgi:hypothetical protein